MGNRLVLMASVNSILTAPGRVDQQIRVTRVSFFLRGTAGQGTDNMGMTMGMTGASALVALQEALGHRRWGLDQSTRLAIARCCWVAIAICRTRKLLVENR